MLGYLLARAGVRVTVLEKHADFFRDFRGDTVHPSTLEVLYELGLLDDFLKLPHQTVSAVRGVFGGYAFKAADFTHLPTHCKFVALMPQWDFLDFLSGKAKQFPEFELRMQHDAVELARDGEQVVGVRAQTPDGPAEISADLVVGCDGRHSTIRRAAQLEVMEYGVPIDVLWFRISRRPDDPEQVLGNINYGRALVLINRGDYFQAGLIIRKGSFEEMKTAGLASFCDLVCRIAPYLGDRVDELKDWDQIKLLTVQINRLSQWYRPGLLCIGDAAHAMSPAGGVGINLAIQDAVATANLLTDPLLHGSVTDADLALVQHRREFPTVATQQFQVFAHNQLAKIFKNTGPVKAPWQLKAVFEMPGVQRLVARTIGMGVRPEHIKGASTSTSRRSTYIKAALVGVGVAAAVVAFALLRRKRGRFCASTS
jgi:2-polyprenyl-6-methoxyphenol hydroxylase-like FAD-dependent oxidoreductase